MLDRRVILVALPFVVSCASSAGMAGGPDVAHEHETVVVQAVGGLWTEADVRFMRDMIGHHEQAITMAAMSGTHGAGERVARLAEKIDISQRDEIGMMKRWLEERGQAVPGDHEMHGMLMPGMLTADQMSQLDAARGGEFDRLFLTFMIQHHSGALQMVEELFSSPGAGQDPDIFRFATDVETDQQAEIDVMRYMLEIQAANSRE